MKRILLIGLLALPSCGAFQSLSKTAGDAETSLRQNQDNMAKLMGNLADVFGQLRGVSDSFKSMDLPKLMGLIAALPQLQLDLKQTQQELRAAAPEAYDAADKDKDGKLSVSEMLAYLMGSGALGAAAIAKLLSKVKEHANAGDVAQQKQLDQQYDQLAELEKAIALMRAQQPKA